jgi:hypothetical protein
MGFYVSTITFVNKRPILWLWYKSGKLQSVVVDGVTVGHPCCGEHKCRYPFASARDHYCPCHAHVSKRCVVLSYNEFAEGGFQTCSGPDHRQLESKYNMSSKVMCQGHCPLTILTLGTTRQAVNESLGHESYVDALGQKGRKRRAET